MRHIYFVVITIGALFCEPIHAESCTESTPGLSTFYSDSWGINHRNQRHQTRTEITADNASSLQLKWSYGYSNNKPRSWPLVTEDTIFIGDTGRGVVALDRSSGCERWVHEHEGEIGSAILHGQINGREALVYTDRLSGVYAIDARTGSSLWSTTIDDEALPMYSGTPLIVGDAVYVPLSSQEIGLSLNPLYGCCTTSGGMASLDLATGQKNWYLPTIAADAAVTGKRWLFVNEMGPSGAPVWGSLMYDESRELIYYGTGQNYSHPTTDTSDAIFAVEAVTGKRRWVHQFTANDAYNLGCEVGPNWPTCPKPMGPDVDFGAPPLMVKTGDTDILIAAQKSSDIYAMDPDTGETLWHQRIGRGGALGGVHWGIAADETTGKVFIPVSDIYAKPGEGEPKPGLYALDVKTGDILWEYVRLDKCSGKRCVAGFSAAIVTTGTLVFAGSLDGTIEAIETERGTVLWEFDTGVEFDAVNNIPTQGGAIDSHGPMVAGNQLIVSSGYGSFGQRPGNALLVFEPAGESQ